MIPAHLEHVFKALTPKEPQQPRNRKSFAPVEGSSPCDDAGTAGVVDLYPVTCRARYYDAASRILEEEPRMHRHAYADELGHVIQKWIEEKRASL